MPQMPLLAEQPRPHWLHQREIRGTKAEVDRSLHLDVFGIGVLEDAGVERLPLPNTPPASVQPSAYFPIEGQVIHALGAHAIIVGMQAVALAALVGDGPPPQREGITCMHRLD